MWIKGDCVVKRLKTPMKYADDEAEYHSKGRYYGHMEIAALAAAMATGFTSRCGKSSQELPSLMACSHSVNALPNSMMNAEVHRGGAACTFQRFFIACTC